MTDVQHMFHLCTECCKAFNLKEDDLGQLQETSLEREPPIPTASSCSTLEETEVSGLGYDTPVEGEKSLDVKVTGDTTLCGFEAEPASKRARVEEDSEVEGSQAIASKRERVEEDSEATGVEGSHASKRERVEEDSEATGVEGSQASKRERVEEDSEATGVEGSQASKRERVENSEVAGVEGIQASERARDEDSKSTEVNRSPVSEKERDTSVSPVCSACLGLLSDSFVSSLSATISRELARANYECLETFRLSISTPLTLIIRRGGLLLYLSEKFEISEALTPHEAYVKESLRRKLYSRLETELEPLRSDIVSPFQIIVKLSHSGSASECRLATETWPDAFSVRKRKRKWGRWKGKSNESDKEQIIINTTSVNRALSTAMASDFEKGDFFSATELCTYSVEFCHSPVFVAGRYCKYSRDLPQTPWLIAGVRKAETSVQELICDPIQRFTRSSDIRFSSSGREDCDVRMLGSGRPFLVEFLNPQKPVLNEPEVEALQLEINSNTKLVEVKQLQTMTKGNAASLKEGEEEKMKEYSALVWAPEKVTQDALRKLGEMKDVVIHQKTPIRVLHRRTLATRDRTIHSMSGELADDHHFYLHLTTQAGTYIKEFVHGDFGRTQPNLRTIMGQDVDILTLDVCKVLLDWPPQK